MNVINLKEIKRDYSISLHKVNRDVVGQIPMNNMKTLTRSIDSIDELTFSVPEYILDRNTYEKISNIVYDDVKKERLICLDDEEYFVIKDINTNFDSKEKDKLVKAYSLEIKLCKIDIDIEDVGIYLTSKDDELGILSLDEYMYKETGWSFGYIDDKVRYDMDEEGNESEKLRWQESVNSSWHDFITKNIQEEYECIAMFNTYNKKINLYHIDSFGDDLQLILSFDNYIKSLQKDESTGDIVTRLKLVGNEEMDIIGATPTGDKFLENYSYFLDNGEMSNELSKAMNKHQEMLIERKFIWEELINQKQVKQSELIVLQTELFEVYEEIKAKKGIKDRYNALEDVVNEAIISAELTKLNDRKVVLEVQIEDLEHEILGLNNKIEEINLLCKRETATDENGELIFTTDLLNELKEFIYYDTYTNDAFLKAEDLVAAGERELSFKCIPTYSYSIDVVNFLRRIDMHPNRQQWDGKIGLGDTIGLVIDKKGKLEEDLIYFVGYTQDFENNGLTIELSNKKLKNNNFRTISDLLGNAKRSMRTITSKRYLWNKQKYNRINL